MSGFVWKNHYSKQQMNAALQGYAGDTIDTNDWYPAKAPREMTREDLGLRRHDWSTSEGRMADAWEKINVSTDPTARKMEMLRYQIRQTLPVLLAEEYDALWERCGRYPE